MHDIHIKKNDLGSFQLSIGCRNYFLQTKEAVLAEVSHYIDNHAQSDELYRKWRGEEHIGTACVATNPYPAPTPVPVSEQPVAPEPAPEPAPAPRPRRR